MVITYSPLAAHELTGVSPFRDGSLQEMEDTEIEAISQLDEFQDLNLLNSAVPKPLSEDDAEWEVLDEDEEDEWEHIISKKKGTNTVSVLSKYEVKTGGLNSLMMITDYDPRGDEEQRSRDEELARKLYSHSLCATVSLI